MFAVQSKGRWASTLLATMMLLALLAQAALAAEPAPAAPDALTADDGGAPEVGVEYVVDYPAGWSDLPATEPDALGLRFQLGRSLFFLPTSPWTRSFAWGNSLAWEQDWKGAGKPGGGTEHIWVDTVDLAYFAGHGNSVGFYFGGASIDDNQLHYNDCRLDWGDGDLEWVGIAACNVLDDPNLGNWAWCMNRLHLILGMKTVMADVAHGDWFGWYIRWGYNMTQAWFKATDKLQPQGVVARVLAEETYHFYDTQNNHIGGDTWDNDYYWWTHAAGSEPARPVNIAALNNTMPVFMTPPLSLDEAEQRWQGLGSAFGVPVTGTFTLQVMPGAPYNNPILTSPDGQLEMDQASGLYAFTDKNRLWAEPITPTLTAPGAVHRITQDEARAIADQFLTQNGLMAQGAQFYEVTADTLTEGTVDRESGLSTLNVTNETNTVWQVIYSRVITYTVPGSGGEGPAEEVVFSVVGPGAKLKVFVPTETTNLAAPVAEHVIGGQGGWREVDNGSGLMAPVAEVPILNYNQVELLFNNLEETVSLAHVPLVYDSREVVTYTLAYYEHPLGVGQDQLIPAYALTVRYNLTNGEVVTASIYIPANPQYMAPLAKITTESAIPERIRPGTQITFVAADAAKNLSDLGYDATLNFPLGTGDPDSYLYNWYLGSVAEENKIGTGRTLNYTVGKGGEMNGQVLVQTIILEVTDSASPRPPSTTRAQVALNVVPPTYLPLAMNNQ